MLQTARLVGRRAGRSRARRTMRRRPSLLEIAYAQAGIAPPIAVPVAAEGIPHPYRALLVHEGEMTRTLEDHIGGPVGLRVLSTRPRARAYFRRVLLVEGASGRPLLMGAVRLRIEALPRSARSEVARGQVPLGRILRAAGVDFLSRPTGYLSVTPNAELMALFRMKAPDTLYGRETDVLLSTRKIGEIVEILPPA
jgi:chorismate-pyruvate lyase